MLPTQDENHVAEGLAYVIGQYKGDPNLTALLTAFLNRVQELEDVTWALIGLLMLSRTLPVGTAQGQYSGPPDVWLLSLADLVQCPVTSTLTGAELQFLLGVWLLARKSRGHADDIITILATAFPPVAGAAQFTYAESYPAAFEAWVPNVPDETLVNAFVEALTLARSQGVYGVLAWGAWPTETFFFGDAHSGAAGSGLCDAYSHTPTNGLLSASEV